MRNIIGILVLGLLSMLSGCVSSLDRLINKVQDEYDLSGNLPREETAILLEERLVKHPLTTAFTARQTSCFFHVEDGDETHNSRRLIVKPGITTFELRCNHTILSGSAGYAKVFTINTDPGHSYGAGIDGWSLDLKNQCLIVTDLTIGVELARQCGGPVGVSRNCDFDVLHPDCWF